MGETVNTTRIRLPIMPGTNLIEKYLQMNADPVFNPCHSPGVAGSIPSSSETVVINGISFLKETGGDAAAGNLFQQIEIAHSDTETFRRWFRFRAISRTWFFRILRHVRLGLVRRQALRQDAARAKPHRAKARQFPSAFAAGAHNGFTPPLASTCGFQR